MKSRFFFKPKHQQIKQLPRLNTVIIGAGPSGLSTATTLQNQGKKVLILEKESVVGGKCHTFYDPKNPRNKTEWGATLIAPNYGKVIDKIEDNHIVLESVLDSQVDSVPFIKKINEMTILEKAQFGARFTKEMMIFAKYAKEYQSLRDARADLPEDYKLSFAEFAKKHDLSLINEFSYLFVPAFGYGLMEQCPAYAVFAYYGMTTIPEISLPQVIKQNGLFAFQHGFQSLMETIAKKFDVKLNTNVESIQRNKEGVTINFRSKDQLYSVSADSLVLAISPLHWPKLGMTLTTTEQQCVDDLTYYQYPVAAVKLKGYPAQHYYQYSGLVSGGQGHLALITSSDNRDNPADGRLCTAYINLPYRKGNNANQDQPFVFTADKMQQLKDELLQVPGVKGVEILKTKVWQDYMSTLPWETRLALDQKQMAQETHTLYAGPYTLGGFEDVACVWEQADKAASQFILKQKPAHGLSFFLNELHRAKFILTTPKAPPFNDAEQAQTTTQLKMG